MASHTIATSQGSPAPDSGRYRTLDMLRGIAAVIVVLYHAGDAYRLGGWYPGFSFLAVDLFFCLSGFVIVRSNDGRFARGLTIGEFMKRRVYRLAPLYLLGWVLALLTLLLPSVLADAAGPSLAPTLALNFLLLPGILPVLFPLNPPGWSLFQELWVVNLLYALLWRRLRPAFLELLIVLATGSLVFTARFHHGLNAGFEHASVVVGVARALFSFFVGVALARLHSYRPARFQVPAIWLCAALVAMLSLPISGWPATAYQLFCIVIGFPALIYWGASARERRPAIGIALGEASYAAYVMHWPLLAFVAWAVRTGLIGVGPGPLLQLTVVAAIMAVSFGVHHLLDQPIRNGMSQGKIRALQRQAR